MATSSEAVELATKFCEQHGLKPESRLKTALLSGHPAVDGEWLVMFESEEASNESPPNCPANTVLVHITADGTASRWDVQQIMREIQERHAKLAGHLLKNSAVDTSPDADGLSQVRGHPVEVRIVQPGVMSGLDPLDPNGTVILHIGTFYILIDEHAIAQQTPNESGSRAKRFVILHEYVHIEEGDVFEERPWPVVRRKYFDKMGHERSERVANGRAASRLADEFFAAGDTQQADRLRAAIQSHGWVTH